MEIPGGALQNGFIISFVDLFLSFSFVRLFNIPHCL